MRFHALMNENFFLDIDPTSFGANQPDEADEGHDHAREKDLDQTEKSKEVKTSLKQIIIKI